MPKIPSISFQISNFQRVQGSRAAYRCRVAPLLAEDDDMTLSEELFRQFLLADSYISGDEEELPECKASFKDEWKNLLDEDTAALGSAALGEMLGLTFPDLSNQYSRVLEKESQGPCTRIR